MKLKVTGRNIEVTDAIKNHLDKIIDKSFLRLGESTGVHVSLHVEKYRHMAEVTVKTKGFTAHATDETGDLYITMDNAFGKIEKQLKKYKERAEDQKIKNGFVTKNIIDN